MSNKTPPADSSRTQETEMVETPLTAQDLTLEEKLSLTSGQTLWLFGQVRHLGPLTLADGPHGVRKPVRELALHESHPATCFPTAAALACSWDTSLLNQVGKLLSIESQHYGVSVLLGPGLNLKRHACGGRNFEYFSEDPLLSGTLAGAYIQGLQADGKVAACAKHFCVNNQESHRFVVNAVVDERTAHELYYRGFEIVLESKPATLMCAYNQVNGVYCSENQHLNTTLLRDEWGFDGLIMTDWGACNDRVQGIRAGMDLEMPGSMGVHNRLIRRALKEGTLSMDSLDTCVDRVLRLIQRYPTPEPVSVDWKTHHRLAKQTAMDCAVLLKNDNLLPLKRDTSVAIIGDFANDHPRYQGMGSSRVLSDSVVTAKMEIQRWTSSVKFATGYHADDEHLEDVNDEWIQEAVDAARESEVALIFIGLPEIMESEGLDREHMHMPRQHNALVEEVLKVNSNVVVILSNGGAVEVPFADEVPAILEGYLLGEASGAAMVDLIFGAQSPCGKLAETWPIHQEDALADAYFPGTRDRVEHREGLSVGYRYFDHGIPVRFPFGHGLSYTSFNYSNLYVESNDDNKSVRLEFDLENTGSVAAKEIVQCYVHPMKSSVYRPEQELGAFKKVFLEPGQSTRVRLDLTKRSFSIYDIGTTEWLVEGGKFEIRVSASSRDIRLTGLVELTGREPSREARTSYPPTPKLTQQVSDDVFATRFGSQQKEQILREIHHEMDHSVFHHNSLMKEVAARRLLGKILFFFVYKKAAQDIDKGASRRRQKRMVKATVEHLPLRALVLFSSGALSFEMLDAVLASMNHRIFQAVKAFAIAFVCLCRKN